MKSWFRIVDTGGVPAFVACTREEIRDRLARLIKPAELLKVPEAEHTEDTRFEAYCRALAEGDRLLDAGEVSGMIDIGPMKFRFIAL